MIWPFPEDSKSAEQVNFAMEIAAKIVDSGFSAYLVGGAVRDSLLGIPNYDVDICTSAGAEVITGLFPEARAHGPKRYCVFRISTGTGEIEIAHFRKERECDGRHCEVELVDDLREDLVRRDFTVNALAVSPSNLEITDDFGGLADIAARCLRAIGDPFRRFADDRLRILRGIRFAAKLDFEIENKTRLAIEHEAKYLILLSNDRLRSEISYTLTNRNPARAISLFNELGIWPHIFTKIQDYPKNLLWPRKLAALDRMQNSGFSPDVLWAVLLMPDIPYSKEDMKRLCEEVDLLGFSARESKAILTLCKITDYAFRFGELPLEQRIETADSPVLDSVREILGNIFPDNEFETHLRRAFPNIGQGNYLRGDKLKAAIEGIPSDYIGKALVLLREAELTGKITTESAAEAFLRSLAELPQAKRL